MKAVRIHSYGGPETLQVESARPLPGAGQVLVRVYAAGVNPLDWKLRAGWLKEMRPLDFPAILGGDISGVVTELGAGVNRFKVGDEVYGVSTMLSGGYAEYALAQADALALKPQSLNHVLAAAVPVVALTAWQALFEVGNLEPGQTVLVHGASGGVGSYAVQLAKLQSIHVIGTAASHNLEFVRGLGADEIIDYETSDFSELVKNVDMVLDTVGGETQTKSFQTLKAGGILVSVAAPPSEALAKQYGVLATMMRMRSDGKLLATLGELFDQRKLKVKIDHLLPLEQAAEAHALGQAGKVHKTVLQIAA